jgi:hypothetical protein
MQEKQHQMELAISRANSHYTQKIPETDTRKVPDYRNITEHRTPVFSSKNTPNKLSPRMKPR